MLVLWRRHTKDCPHKHEGRDYLKCRCSIWIDWRVSGKRVRKPLGLRDWQAAQHKDECELQKAALEALQASLVRPLTKDEAMAVAYSAGLANDFYKETR